MILRVMLQRLYAALASGPGLNARPHHSRQRADLMELRHLGGADPAGFLAQWLGGGTKTAEWPARVPAFRRPEAPESEWSESQRAARTAQERQTRLLDKLRDIAEDAPDYYSDHGDHALFVGFPLVSLPPARDRQGGDTKRVLAPAVLVPVNLRVRRGANPGVTLELAGEGGELVQPNPALLAWIEQQTGTSTEALFNDETGDDPWREIAGMLALTAKAVGLPAAGFDAGTPLLPVPRAEELPAHPAVLPGAVLGLFPLANPGLLRDTRWMQEHEADLPNPVKPFLSAAALAEPEPGPAAAAGHPPAQAPADFAEAKPPADATLGLLTDFTRYAKTPNPIAWEQLRSAVLTSQGWELHRLWTPALFREPRACMENLRARHERSAGQPLKAAPPLETGPV
jgi:hypothetical protein